MTQRWRDWLDQAEHDLEHAAASKCDGRHAWACFASHQAAEKAVKALHVAGGKRLTGNVITRLLTELPETPPEDLVDRGRVLDNYYIPTRSPRSHADGAAYEHYGALQSEQGLRFAGDILKYVRQALAVEVDCN
ncbi:MAG: HEPN domain-containing protein [Gemmatimonadota bacterium]|nr:HEPN domain-containing protein [Gemmatimonadota bacterium]